MDCLFCRQLESGDHRSEDLLVEDEQVFAYLHQDWSVLGHSVVVWKSHVQNLSDLSPAALHHYMSTFQRIEKALLCATKAERAVIFKLGVMVPHLHLHIYPVPVSADRAQVMAAIEGQKQREVNLLERQDFRQLFRSLFQAG